MRTEASTDLPGYWTLRTIQQLEQAGFKRVTIGNVPYWSYGLPGGYEVAVEPLAFGGWAIAIYDSDQELVLPQKAELGI